MNRKSYPSGSKIRFQFPSRKFAVAGKSLALDPVTLWWYDGGKAVPGAHHDGSNMPPAELTADIVALYKNHTEVDIYMPAPGLALSAGGRSKVLI